MNTPRRVPALRPLATHPLGSLLLAAAALTGCGGGSSGNEPKPQSTAIDAAAAATGSVSGVAAAASAAEPSASAASAAELSPADVAASAAAPTVKIAAAAAEVKTPQTPPATTPSTTTSTPGSRATATTTEATAVSLVNTTAPATSLSSTMTSASAQLTSPTAQDTANQAGAGAQTATQTAAARLQAALTASLASTQVDQLLKTSGVLLSANVPIDNISGAKSLATTNKDWVNWVAYKKEQVNKWFAKPRDRLDLVAGYVNDFVDPKTGAPADWSMEMPEPAAGTTDREKAFKGAWVAIQRQYNIKYALDAARIYQLSGDTKLAEIAAAQLDFYADNYMKWPLRTAIGNARMLGQSLDEAVSVLTMLEISRALTPYATAARKAKWRDGVFYPLASNVQTYSWGSLNNINLWCAIATAAVGMEYGNATLTDAGLTGPRSVAAVMSQGITQDGVWFEGSFAYNNYVLAALTRLFDLSVATGRTDVILRYTPDVQRMLMAPVLYRFDDGSLPSPNDTRFAVAPVDAATHGGLYRYVPTTFGMQYALANRSWSTLFDPPTSVSLAPTLPPARTVYSPDTGFTSLRAGNWQVFIHYGQKTQAHAQAEALTYELADGTTNISRDAGTSNSYGSPQHQEYFSQGLGNNVPLVDGQGADGYTLGEVKSFDPTTGFLDVLQASYRTDASARRSFKLDANGFSESSRITLTKAGATPRRLGVVFNTTCSIQVTDPRAGAASSTTAPTGAPGFKYWTSVTRQTAQATWTAKLNCAGKAYELTVVGPAAHVVYRATAPSTPLPNTRNTLYLETTGTDATFSTSIRAL